MKWIAITGCATLVGFFCGRISSHHPILSANSMKISEKPRVMFTLSPTFGSIGVAVTPNATTIEGDWLEYYEIDPTTKLVQVMRWDNRGTFGMESSSFHHYEISPHFRSVIEERALPATPEKGDRLPD